LPANWTLANYETITYGPNGAEFTFSKRHDAPSISTDFYILFGYVEVVMKASPGVGVISSAVLMSDGAGEIDLEFSGNNFGAAGGKVQTNYFGKGMIGNYDRGTRPMVEDPQIGFHTYALD
jgi:beta-glucanase (GH16 family)